MALVLVACTIAGAGAAHGASTLANPAGAGAAHGARTPASPALATANPRDALDALLTADVSFSAAAATRDLLTGLGAMFAADVVMPAPGIGFATSRDAAIAALRRDTLNATSKAVWSPVRGGISADGLHGFTYGYMTVTRRDGARVPYKYLSYWVKGPEGWRVAAYKRGRRPNGDVSLDMLPPALPAALVAPTNDEATLAGLRTSLAAAEKAFSDEAQSIGLGPAFTKWGSSDAMNLGSVNDTSFVLGNTRIGAAVGGSDGAQPATINWSSDRVIVASSGDLGVSIGYIRQNAPAAATPAQGFPFFTIWRRATAASAWRYVAE